MRIHYLQHVAFEELGSIEDWVIAGEHSLSGTRLFRGESLPDPDALDWLVVMGGPMSVHDEDAYAWLAPEKRFIEGAIAHGKTVLGICLGAQLVAQVLGGAVFRSAHKEIGWHPITVSKQAQESEVLSPLSRPPLVFHWHGETFEIPPGAMRLAGSEGCLNQGFVYGAKVIALQFHLEVTRQGLQKLIDNCRGDIIPGPYVQTPREMLARAEAVFTQVNTALSTMLDRICHSMR